VHDRRLVSKMEKHLRTVGGEWRHEMREVLTNLVFNAVDAMPKGRHDHPSPRCRERGRRQFPSRKREWAPLPAGGPGEIHGTIFYHQGGDNGRALGLAVGSLWNKEQQATKGDALRDPNQPEENMMRTNKFSIRRSGEKPRRGRD